MTWLNSEITQVSIMKFLMLALHHVRILGIALQATTRYKYLLGRLTQAYLRLKSITKDHETNHTLNMCRAFRSKPISARREFLKKNGLCFRCCGPRKHTSKTCKETIKCFVCNSNKHSTALHVDTTESENSKSLSHYGEEASKTVNTTYTQICGNLVGYSKSCAKLVLVRTYPYGRPDQSRTLYCLIDDQSNRSLDTSSFFDAFSENGLPIEYVLSSCSGKYTTAGRRESGYVDEAFDKGFSLSLPELIECD